MIERNVTIQNPEGLHARPAGVFVKVASQFRSTVKLRSGESLQNAKSIMSLMSMGLKSGAQVTLVIEGEDEALAADALAGLIDRQFTLLPRESGA